MKLTDVTISFPLIKFGTNITYFSSRISTAIEWGILETVKRISENPNSEFANYSVDLFFTSVFLIGVEGDTNVLIKPCLFNLNDINAIYFEQSLNDNTDLRDFPMSAIKLTDEGREMQEKGLLPGEDLDISCDFLFDLRKNIIQFFNDNKPGVAKGIKICEDEDNLFNTPLPIIQIKDFLLKVQQNQKTAPSWIQPNTEFKDIVLQSFSDNIQIFWQNKSIPINFDNNMQLFIGNNSDSDVLEFVAESLIENSFGYTKNDNLIKFISVNDINKDVKNLYQMEDIGGIIGDEIDRNNFFIINSDFMDIDIDEILDNSKGKICIYISNQDFDIKNDSNLIVKIPSIVNDENIVDSSLIYTNLKKSVNIGNFDIHYGENNRKLILGYEPTILKENYVDLIESIVSSNYKNYTDLLYLLIGIGKNNDFIKCISDVVEEENSLSDKISFLDKTNQKSQSFFSKNFNNEFNDIILTQLKWNKSENEVEQICNLLSQMKDIYKFKNKPDFLKKSLTHIFSNWNNCENTDDLWKVLENSKITKEIFNWLRTQPFINNLFSKEIFIDILKKYELSDFEKIPVYTKFEENLVNLKKNQIELEKLLNGEKIPTNLSSDSLKNYLLKSRLNLKNINEVLKKRKDIKNNLNNYLSIRKIAFEDLCFDGNSYFVRAEETIKIINDTVLKFYNESALKYEKIYIVDTCSLMNNPELIDRFQNNKSALIIPKKVTEELNKNKDFEKDDEKSQKAQNAIKKIAQYQSKNVPWLIYEESHPELLPIDYPATTKDANGDIKIVNDNLILSVALKYKVRNVTLISDDNNLSQKSVSEKIDCKTSNQFIGIKNKGGKK